MVTNKQWTDVIGLAQISYDGSKTDINPKYDLINERRKKKKRENKNIETSIFLSDIMDVKWIDVGPKYMII